MEKRTKVSSVQRSTIERRAAKRELTVDVRLLPGLRLEGVSLDLALDGVPERREGDDKGERSQRIRLDEAELGGPNLSKAAQPSNLVSCALMDEGR
jgi:hypothetical protein